MEDRETEKVERGRTHSSLQTQLAQVERELKRERERVKQLEEEQETQTLAREGLERDTEREQQFYQRLASALKLDNSATAQVLTGDFTRDAILVRAEQMAKHEVASETSSGSMATLASHRPRLWLRSSRLSTLPSAS